MVNGGAAVKHDVLKYSLVVGFDSTGLHTRFPRPAFREKSGRPVVSGPTILRGTPFWNVAMLFHCHAPIILLIGPDPRKAFPFPTGNSYIQAATNRCGISFVSRL